MGQVLICISETSKSIHNKVEPDPMGQVLICLSETSVHVNQYTLNVNVNVNWQWISFNFGIQDN